MIIFSVSNLPFSRQNPKEREVFLSAIKNFLGIRPDRGRRVFQVHLELSPSEIFRLNFLLMWRFLLYEFRPQIKLDYAVIGRFRKVPVQFTHEAVIQGVPKKRNPHK